MGTSFGAQAVRGGFVPNGTQTAVEVTTNANAYRGATVFQGGFYGANSGSTGYQVHLIGGAAAFNAAPIASPAPTPMGLPGEWPCVKCAVERKDREYTHLAMTAR